ncbi:hypothetical protein REPUB_Repub01dG0067200 [Reevesia pubescens]
MMEDLGIQLEEWDEQSLALSRHMAIGKLVTEKVLNRRGVRNILRNIWSVEVAPRISDLGENRYGISFRLEELLNRVHGLPIEMLMVRNTKNIGNTIGTMLAVEDLVLTKGIGRGFLRIRVELNWQNPLVDGFWFPREWSAIEGDCLEFDEFSLVLVPDIGVMKRDISLIEEELWIGKKMKGWDGSP